MAIIFGINVRSRTMTARLFPKSLSAKHVIYAGSIQREDNGCWEWQHGKHNAGYGVVYFGGKQVTTHRLAWSAWNGPIPEGGHILHKCDNPPCVNPVHLYLGDHAQNMRDMGLRRRQWLAARKDTGGAVPPPVIPEDSRAKGERVGTSKLCEADILSIRSDSRKQRDIAKDYGISQCQVWRIKHKHSWAWV